MTVVLAFVVIAALLPIVTLLNERQLHPVLVLVACALSYMLIGYSTTSTNEWIRPFITEAVYPVLIGYISSQLILERRKVSSKKHRK